MAENYKEQLEKDIIKLKKQRDVAAKLSMICLIISGFCWALYFCLIILN